MHYYNINKRDIPFLRRDAHEAGTTETCTITLPLKTEKWQADRLDKRFELGRLLYNTQLMERKKAYRSLW